MINYTSFSSEEEETIGFILPEKVKDISIGYDGGRLSIFINGKEVYVNMCAGNDFSVDINSD